MFSKIKEWFGKVRLYVRSKWIKLMSFFDDSETKFIAAVQGVIGFVLLVIGGLDWSTLVSAATTGIDMKTGLTLGSVLVIKSLIDVVARKYRDKDI